MSEYLQLTIVTHVLPMLLLQIIKRTFMKKIIVLSLALFCPLVMAEPIWVGVQWTNHEKPIIMPIQFKNEDTCLKMLKKINQITQSTIEVERNIMCQKLLPAEQ